MRRSSVDDVDVAERPSKQPRLEHDHNAQSSHNENGNDIQSELAKQQQILVNLRAWARSYGSVLGNVELKAFVTEEGTVERGCFATANINDKDIIATIANDIVLSEGIARDSTVGKCLAEYLKKHQGQEISKEDDPAASSVEDTAGGENQWKSGSAHALDPHAEGVLFMCAFMIWDRFEGQDSTNQDGWGLKWSAESAKPGFFLPYLASLPTEFPTIPLFWSDDQLTEEFKGTNMELIIKHRKKVLKKGFETLVKACGHMFHSGSLTWEKFLWAYSSISSRAFPKISLLKASARESKKSERTQLCLYPVLDMLNHQRARKIEWNTVRCEGQIAFVALESTAKGQEVFNNYGAKGNENFLSNYGFVLDPNPEDYFKFSLAIQDADPLAGEKRRILRGLNDRCGASRQEDHGVQEPAQLKQEQSVETAQSRPISMVHLLFVDNDSDRDEKRMVETETEKNGQEASELLRQPIPTELLRALRLFSMNNWEISQTIKTYGIQSEKEGESQSVGTKSSISDAPFASAISLRNDMAALSALYGLLWNRLDKLERFERDRRQLRKSSPDTKTATQKVRERMSLVYRQGQIRVLRANLRASIVTTTSILNQNTTNDLLHRTILSLDPFFGDLDTSLQAILQHSNPAFVRAICTMMRSFSWASAEDEEEAEESEEGPLDEDTALALILMNERALGEDSRLAGFLRGVEEKAGKMDDVIAAFASDAGDDARMHFEDVVEPLISAWNAYAARRKEFHMLSEHFNVRTFLWACAVLEMYGVTLDRRFLTNLRSFTETESIDLDGDLEGTAAPIYGIAIGSC
ncbi:hypothetical protein HK102_005608 [Quaeritorhiza haematococci]|nr:hypothetical protein HK102_005608 [Quaeritorhiza haematococci]